MRNAADIFKKLSEQRLVELIGGTNGSDFSLARRRSGQHAHRVAIAQPHQHEGKQQNAEQNGQREREPAQDQLQDSKHGKQPRSARAAERPPQPRGAGTAQRTPHPQPLGTHLRDAFGDRDLNARNADRRIAASHRGARSSP